VGTHARSRRRAPQKVKPYLQRIIDRIDAPAIVMTPTHDVLAWNPLAAALMVDFGEVPERERNFVRLLFTDPRMRSLYPEWEELARSVVSYLRMEAARKPDDPRLAELVGDLSIRDAQFRQWWAGTHVAVKRRGTRRYNHPVVGEITLEWDALTSDAEPDQQLIVYNRRARLTLGARAARARSVGRGERLSLTRFLGTRGAEESAACDLISDPAGSTEAPCTLQAVQAHDRPRRCTRTRRTGCSSANIRAEPARRARRRACAHTSALPSTMVDLLLADERAALRVEAEDPLADDPAAHVDRPQRIEPMRLSLVELADVAIRPGP
jgi:hypothetical protein